MQKARKIILIISLVTNVVLGYILYNKPKQIGSSDFSEYIEKIDSLELELQKQNGHRDSIENEIDTIYIKIKDNNTEYEEDRDVIINNSTNDDYIFFIDYLSGNKSRLDSINNL